MIGNETRMNFGDNFKNILEIKQVQSQYLEIEIYTKVYNDITNNFGEMVNG